MQLWPVDQSGNVDLARQSCMVVHPCAKLLRSGGDNARMNRIKQECLKCFRWAHFTLPATLLSDCVAYGLPNPGLRLCIGATAVSRYLRRFHLGFNVLRENISTKSVAKECFCFKPLAKCLDYANINYQRCVPAGLLTWSNLALFGKCLDSAELKSWAYRPRDEQYFYRTTNKRDVSFESLIH